MRVQADWLIDLGPGAGNAGGQIVASGSPAEVAKSELSRTAPFLRDALAT
jgi:excinuclease ABC subunit A